MFIACYFLRGPGSTYRDLECSFIYWFTSPFRKDWITSILHYMTGSWHYDRQQNIQGLYPPVEKVCWRQLSLVEEFDVKLGRDEVSFRNQGPNLGSLILSEFCLADLIPRKQSRHFSWEKLWGHCARNKQNLASTIVLSAKGGKRPFSWKL